jgi:hypothetical protein
MSNWIEEEAQKYRVFASDAQSRAQVFARSQLWERLVEQVKNDAIVISGHPIWKTALGPGELTVNDTDEGLEILKSGYPTVRVLVTNQPYSLVVDTKVTQASDVEPETTTEVLTVSVVDGLVKLKGEKSGLYDVPGPASRHLFKPILDSFRRAFYV